MAKKSNIKSNSNGSNKKGRGAADKARRVSNRTARMATVTMTANQAFASLPPKASKALKEHIEGKVVELSQAGVLASWLANFHLATTPLDELTDELPMERPPPKAADATTNTNNQNEENEEENEEEGEEENEEDDDNNNNGDNNNDNNDNNPRHRRWLDVWQGYYDRAIRLILGRGYRSSRYASLNEAFDEFEEILNGSAAAAPTDDDDDDDGEGFPWPQIITKDDGNSLEAMARQMAKDQLAHLKFGLTAHVASLVSLQAGCTRGYARVSWLKAIGVPLGPPPTHARKLSPAKLAKLQQQHQRADAMTAEMGALFRHHPLAAAREVQARIDKMHNAAEDNDDSDDDEETTTTTTNNNIDIDIDIDRPHQPHHFTPKQRRRAGRVQHNTTTTTSAEKRKEKKKKDKERKKAARDRARKKRYLVFFPP